MRERERERETHHVLNALISLFFALFFALLLQKFCNGALGNAAAALECLLEADGIFIGLLGEQLLLRKRGVVSNNIYFGVTHTQIETE